MIPRRMSPAELRQAARTIDRLMRNKAVSKKKRAPAAPAAEREPRPEGYRQTIHVGLNGPHLDGLDKIAAALGSGSLGKVGRAAAARHAIAYCAARLPVTD
jgi:hypothetical protein